MSKKLPESIRLNPDFPDQFHRTTMKGEPCIAVPLWAIRDLSSEGLMIASLVVAMGGPDGRVSLDAIHDQMDVPWLAIYFAVQSMLEQGVFLQ